jgi:hypothetical protein
MPAKNAAIALHVLITTFSAITSDVVQGCSAARAKM